MAAVTERRRGEWPTLSVTTTNHHCCLQVSVFTCVLRFVFESLQGSNRAWLLVVYIVTPRRLLSLYGIIYVTWYTNHLAESVTACLVFCMKAIKLASLLVTTVSNISAFGLIDLDTECTVHTMCTVSSTDCVEKQEHCTIMLFSTWLMFLVEMCIGMEFPFPVKFPRECNWMGT